MTYHEGETLGLSILRSELLRIDPHLNPIFVLSKITLKDFPVVKTSPSNARDVGLSLVSELRSHIPGDQKKNKT